MTSHAPNFYFPAPRTQRFCSQCGTPLIRRIPPDDNRERDLCEHCGAVHYQNPRNVVGVLPVWQGKILLCKRAIEPRADKWTLPAGFMELGETTDQGALRENQEESGAQIELEQLYTIIDVPHAEQVHFFFLARVLNEQLAPGPESLEAGFFGIDEIPWDELAFRTIISTLEHYVSDLATGVFPVRHYTIPGPAPR
ncbi:NUDIX hydrolase [Allopusillimonas soli]|uniref:NUDIX hydrolase n=1 Tax=Allopusillimonas soli TaxID=659016 RepID=A0A853FGK1_9BURK|nr:NUDIX hydrolase [Allopusillimonas soli]NYT39007.1 NUDIX hydrolase [Allopusillimonas soli]TEA69553.1 NUDIX hydrolase [Allopusillimonas soli]